MKPKLAGAVVAGGALMLALVGCTLNQTSLREKADKIQIGGGSEVLIPKRIALRIMVASRPQGDPALGVSIWHVADEQAIDPETRRVLQSNGLRIGRASGDLPPEVQAVLDAPPPKKIDPQTLVLPEGDFTLVTPDAPARPELSLILGLRDKIVGKDYQDAHGFFRVSATYDGPEGVALRITPEIHHGPVKQGWGVAGGATPMSPSQIVTKNGQREEAFRDMATNLVLQPGQVAVLGGRGEKRGSLGDFLFCQPVDNSDRPVEKVILIWATRSDGAGSTPAIPANLTPVDPTAEK